MPLAIQRQLFKKMHYNKPCGYGEVYSVTMDNALNTFLTDEERSDKKLVRQLKNDIIGCWIKYKALPYEYFLFNFRHRTDAERSEFETDRDRIEVLCAVSSNQLYKQEINDKYNFYQLAKPYFRREAMKLSAETDSAEFAAFVKKAEIVFVKPLRGTKGAGAHKYTYIDDDSAKQFCRTLLEEDAEWMVEECIRQSAEMAQWNESSVNTIRIPTFLREGKFTVKWTRLRMGKKGFIVDNAGAGGIVVNVDPTTGIMITDGIDEYYNHFEKHPDTGKVFKGWQVPRWQELLDTVEELHRTRFSKHIYVAWDFALTDKGWVVIEGNWGQLLGQQTASQVGVKKEFYELVGV